MKRTLVRWLQHFVFQPNLVPVFTRLYKVSLRGMGILNSEGSEATGEQWLFKTASKHLPIKVVCDVGANEGGYTKEMAEYFPKASYYCFEPNPQTFKLLVNQTAKLPVTVHNLAVSRQNGPVKLYDFSDQAPLKPTQPTATMASLYRDVIVDFHRQPAKSYQVDAVTLDHWAKTTGITRIDWLKIDTEGHELSVLTGARGLISDYRIGLIQFEFNEMNVYSRVFFKNFLEALPGYSFYRLLPHGWIPLNNYRPLTHEIFGFQNLVALNPDWQKKLPL